MSLSCDVFISSWRVGTSVQPCTQMPPNVQRWCDKRNWKTHSILMHTQLPCMSSITCDKWRPIRAVNNWIHIYIHTETERWREIQCAIELTGLLIRHRLAHLRSIRRRTIGHGVTCSDIYKRHKRCIWDTIRPRWRRTTHQHERTIHTHRQKLCFHLTYD